MEKYLDLFIIYFVIINAVIFFMMYSDKKAARKKQWRVPEAYLFLLTLLGGSPAMILSMVLFRHKNRKKSFIAKALVIVIIQILALWYLSTLV